MYRWSLTVTSNPGHLQLPTRTQMRAHAHTLRASLTSHLSAVLSSDDVAVTLHTTTPRPRGSAVIGARGGRGQGLRLAFELQRLAPGEVGEDDVTGEEVEPADTARRQRRAAIEMLTGSTRAARDCDTDKARHLLQQAERTDPVVVRAFRAVVAEHGLVDPDSTAWSRLIVRLHRYLQHHRRCQRRRPAPWLVSLASLRVRLPANGVSTSAEHQGR